MGLSDFGGNAIEFCSKSWLRSPHLPVDMLMALLNQDLQDHKNSLATAVCTTFGQKLIDEIRICSGNL
jgi:hypothetical protein